MKLYLGNNFSDHMVVFLKRCCLVIAFLMAANPKALENKNDFLPKFGGIYALELKEGVVIHPSHILVKLKNEKGLPELKRQIEGEGIDFKKEYSFLPGVVLLEVNHEGLDTNYVSLYSKEINNPSSIVNTTTINEENGFDLNYGFGYYLDDDDKEGL